MTYEQLVEETAKMMAEIVKRRCEESGYTTETMLEMMLESFGVDVADYAATYLLEEWK